MLQEKQRTPEQELLLASIRTGPAPDTHIRELLKSGIDWAALRRTAREHGVLPLLYVRLKQLEPDLLPVQEMAHLQNLFRANAHRNILKSFELLNILRLLSSRNIPAIAFKGPSLAVRAYGDVCLRQFVDLDLLARREDMKKVAQLLAEHGYRPRYAFTPVQEKAHFKRANELTFSPVEGGSEVDVHWRFAADYFTACLNPAEAFARQATVGVEGRVVPTLPDDSMLLYLCLHGTLHLWRKLNTICDVARLIDASRDIQWQRLLGRAEAAGLRRMFLLGLGLAQEFMETRAPAEITALIDADRSVKKLREHVQEGLFNVTAGAPGFAETAWFHLLAKDSMPDKIRYCAIRAFLPTLEDWKLCRLPDALYVLYFVLRPLRLAKLIPKKTPLPGSSSSLQP